MSEPVIVLDSGAIDQVVTNKEFRAVLDDLVRQVGRRSSRRQCSPRRSPGVR